VRAVLADQVHRLLAGRGSQDTKDCAMLVQHVVPIQGICVVQATVGAGRIPQGDDELEQAGMPAVSYRETWKPAIGSRHCRDVSGGRVCFDLSLQRFDVVESGGVHLSDSAAHRLGLQDSLDVVDLAQVGQGQFGDKVPAVRLVDNKRFGRQRLAGLAQR
jgi:hypothetical protein